MLLSADEEKLIEEEVQLYIRRLLVKSKLEKQVDSYRKKLETEVLKAKEREDPEIETVMSNLTLCTTNDDNNSIATEACNMCFLKSDEIDEFNFKMRANCECAVMGCFECWNAFYKQNKQNATIACPKCRRDITAFLKDEGFVKLKRCSRCRRTGHNVLTCPDDVNDDDLFESNL